MMGVSPQIRLATALLALAAPLCAQQSLPRLDGGAAQPAASPAAPAPLKPMPGKPDAFVPPIAVPAAPAEKPAAPAAITFQEGLLTIHAENSSLAQILADISAKTGMTVEGKPEDERIFGNFGPAPVANVVAQLLDGGNSNYVLFGRSENHAPRSLVISPRTGPPPTTLATGASPAAQVQSNDDDDDDDAPQAMAPIRPLVPVQQENQSPPPQNAQPNPGIRTPQQILEEMQRRRAEQQQQNLQQSQ